MIFLLLATITGIALFTYHKYRKSVDSQFVPSSDSSRPEDDYAMIGPSLELEERDPLTITGASGDDGDAYERVSNSDIYHPGVPSVVERGERDSRGERHHQPGWTKGGMTAVCDARSIH